MIATHVSHFCIVGQGLLILLIYGLFFWRLIKSGPRNRLVDWGFLTLTVFAAIVPVGNPRDVPNWLFGTWLVLVVLHCFATLLLRFQRMFRALVQRS